VLAHSLPLRKHQHHSTPVTPSTYHLPPRRLKLFEAIPSIATRRHLLRVFSTCQSF
jgi:hypothetical protein